VILDRIAAGIFGAGVHFRNQLYDRRRLRINELRGPVISVGNISVGGSGKTPFVILLGEMLKQRGIPFDILSRGYGRITKGVSVVDPAGTPQEFGDEPLLMARRLGVQVVVGESRYAAGLEAEKRWGPRLHLLDDAFQHRRLARQFDIVLVTPGDFRDVLLPAGRLREPLCSVNRADAIVLTGDPPENSPHLTVKHVWHATRTLHLENPPRCPVAFCAIGRPQNFFGQLQTIGVIPVAEVPFRDHRCYTQSDIRRLLRFARSKHADVFITTEKDAINLGSLADQLSPLSIVKLDMSIDNPDAVLDTIVANLRQRGKPLA
jgi:tetraacyldisaccharide 4'-kinase